MHLRSFFLGIGILFSGAGWVEAQPPKREPYQVDAAVQKASVSPMRPYLDWFQADRGNLTRFYTIPLSATRQTQFRPLPRMAGSPRPASL